MNNEEKIRESEKTFQNMIRYTSDITAFLSEEGTIKYINPSFYRILDYKEDVTGQNVFEFISREDHPELRRGLKQIKNHQGENNFIELRIIDRLGNSIYIEATGNYLNEDNNLKGFLVNARDITHRKQKEEKLNAHNNKLKKINDELDSFVYSAAHDLKAPLKSVTGIIELLRIENDPSKSKNYLTLISKTIHKLDNFIKEVVDYSRNSRTEVKQEFIDFKFEIEEIFNDLNYMKEAENIEKIIEVNQPKPFYGDIYRTRVILNNLIGNAIRYSNPQPSKKPFIKVNVTFDNDLVIINISDNGQGIGKNEQKKIYEMFYRASTSEGGSGLGLYIVQETIKKLNGTINVDSKKKEGTTFTIKLPSTSNIQQKEGELNPA